MKDGSIKVFGALPQNWSDPIVLNLRRCTERELEIIGFKELVTPELSDGEQLGEVYYDGVIGKYTYKVLTIEYDLNKVYTDLLSELDDVATDFRMDLMKVSYEDVIRGIQKPEFIELVNQLELTKVKIKQALDYYLSECMLDKLLSFSFDTEEAKQLKQAIQQYKK